MTALGTTVATDGSKLLIEGKDNYGNLRQEFANKLASASDDHIMVIAEERIWLSAYASNNPRSDYHWQADACYDESVRRGSTGEGSLYDQAWHKAAGSAG